MIVIEGADLVGKTTLARTLITKLNEEGFPHTYSHLSRLPESFHRYWGYVNRMNANIVQDRFHMSEVMYAVMRGDNTSLTPEVYELVDAQLRLQNGFTVVICAADDSVILDRWREDEMYSRADVLRVNKLYLELITHSRYFRGYHMTYNLTITLTKEEPFVNDYIIDAITELYKSRVLTHRNIIREKVLWTSLM